MAEGLKIRGGGGASSKVVGTTPTWLRFDLPKYEVLASREPLHPRPPFPVLRHPWFDATQAFDDLIKIRDFVQWH